MLSLFGLGRTRKKAVKAEATLISFSLLEDGKGAQGGKGCWLVESVWSLADASPDLVDLPALMHELHGQLSDGWGEGVEQIWFGPIVVCEDDDGGPDEGCRPAKGAAERALDVSTHGRWSFNLTVASRGTWKPVVKVTQRV